MGKKKKTRVPTVPVEKFGKDHWSLLAYVECRCVDHRNTLEHDHLRTNPDRNPDLGYRRNAFGGKHWKDEYSTRLKTFPWKSEDEKEQAKHRVSGHDDWDCLDDLERAGFVQVLSYVNGSVEITEAGLAMAAHIRAHKAKGGWFSNFTPPAGNDKPWLEVGTRIRISKGWPEEGRTGEVAGRQLFVMHAHDAGSGARDRMR